MKSTQNLPQRLKELRNQHHYSQEDLAEKLNVTRQAVSRWENGKAFPDIDNLLLIAELYNISVDELLQENNVRSDSSDTLVISTDNNATLEIIGLLVILVLSINFSFAGIPIAVVTFGWLVRTHRKYKILYIMCIICVFIGVYELISVYMHLKFFYGIQLFSPVK